MTAVAHIEDRWRSIFDYAATRETGAIYTLTMHPQTIGRAHMILLLERLLEHFAERGAAFMTLSEVADATRFD